LFESALGAWFEELDGASLLVIADPAPSSRRLGADAVHGRGVAPPIPCPRRSLELVRIPKHGA